MDLKWCTKLDVVEKKCPIVFRGHPSNFTVTRAENLTIWIQIEITWPVAAIKSLRFALFHASFSLSKKKRSKRRITGLLLRESNSRKWIAFTWCQQSGKRFHHDDVIKWKHFPRYWPFVWGIAGNSPVTGEFPAQSPMTLSFDVFCDLRPNKRLSKQSQGRWLRRHRAHYDVIVMMPWRLHVVGVYLVSQLGWVPENSLLSRGSL